MQLPSEVPVMTLPGATLFPQAMLPLYIFERRYRRMLADALASHRMFSVAMQRPNTRHERPVAVAGLGLIRASVTHQDGTSRLILQGIARVEISETKQYRPYRVHEIRPFATATSNQVVVQALTAKVLEMVDQRLKLGFDLPFKTLKDLETDAEVASEPLALQAFREAIQHVSRIEDPEQLADLISATLLAHSAERQVILQTPDLEARLRFLIRFLEAEIDRVRQSKPV